MAVMAVWVECVYFSVHILSESMATSLFLAAAALLHGKARMRAIVAAGLLMGLAGLMRFQFAPAIALYAAMVAGRDRRLWKGLLAGGLPVVALGAGIDVAMGLTPYEWILTNYRMNIGEGRMREIGGISHSHYLFATIHFWKWAALIIPVLVALAWKQHKALIVMAIANIAAHQLIGHKEYRYLWLSMQTLLLVAALGSVNASRFDGWRAAAGRSGELKRDRLCDRRLVDGVLVAGDLGHLSPRLAGQRRPGAARGPGNARSGGVRAGRAEARICTVRLCAASPAQAALPDSRGGGCRSPIRAGSRPGSTRCWFGRIGRRLRIPAESGLPGRAARSDLPVPAAGRLLGRSGNRHISIRKRCFGWTARPGASFRFWRWRGGGRG